MHIFSRNGRKSVSGKYVHNTSFINVLIIQTNYLSEFQNRLW